MKKIILLVLGILVLFVIIGAMGGNKTYQVSTKTQVKQEVAAQPTVVEVDAATFIGEFDKNKLVAEEKYQGKTVRVEAKITNISETFGKPYLLLTVPTENFFGGSISCSFADKSSLMSLENGNTVAVIGVVKGQSVGIVTMEDCRIVK